MKILLKIVSCQTCVVLALLLTGCCTTRQIPTPGQTASSAENAGAFSKVIPIYEDAQISGSIGISKGYTLVDGYRYVNIAVEYEQKAPNEAPLSLGVIFAHDSQGKWGARHYVSFEENVGTPADPHTITISGKNSWSGHPHNKSHYIARLPILGPYMSVFPFNQHNQSRKFSVVLYLTK